MRINDRIYNERLEAHFCNAKSASLINSSNLGRQESLAKREVAR